MRFSNSNSNFTPLRPNSETRKLAITVGKGELDCSEGCHSDSNSDFTPLRPKGELDCSESHHSDSDYHSYFLLLLLFLLPCCSPAELGPPPVDTDRLATVLTDLHIAESINTEIPVALRDSMRTVYEDRVLEDHDMSRVYFDSLMWIVRKEPEWVADVYTRVTDALAKKEADSGRVPQKVKEQDAKN